MAVAGVAIGVTLSSSGHSSSRQVTTAPASAVPPSTTASTPPAPTTTALPAPAVTPVSTDASGAVYDSSGPVSVDLVATGRCWVDLRSGSATGPPLYQGVLSPGDHKVLTSPSGVWLRLGYPPGVQVHLDGAPVTLPGPSPYDITVQVTAATQG
jgi:cytoskeletal protein RodZ